MNYCEYLTTEDVINFLNSSRCLIEEGKASARFDGVGEDRHVLVTLEAKSGVSKIYLYDFECVVEGPLAKRINVNQLNMQYVQFMTCKFLSQPLPDCDYEVDYVSFIKRECFKEMHKIIKEKKESGTLKSAQMQEFKTEIFAKTVQIVDRFIDDYRQNVTDKRLAPYYKYFPQAERM